MDGSEYLFSEVFVHSSDDAIGMAKKGLLDAKLELSDVSKCILYQKSE